MKAPGFWQRPAGLASRLLAPIGALYGAVTLKRMTQPGARVGVPVICVGNPTLGGVGKTPTALAIADWFARAGRTPFILSRGYGGRLEGPLIVDPARHTAADVGDEPLLLARHHPVVVARQRFEGAQLAVSAGAGVIIMDDGFQNPALHKDLSLLLIDAAAGLGNGAVFPAGPLRAPLAPQLARADALMLIGDGAKPELEHQAARLGKPLVRARLVPEAVAGIQGADILAFCGIGRPEKFAATLNDLGARSVTLRGFPDHHAYSESDLAALLAQANSHTLATTEKDAVKLAATPAGRALLAQTLVVPVKLVADDGLAALLQRLF